MDFKKTHLGPSERKVAARRATTLSGKHHFTWPALLRAGALATALAIGALVPETASAFTNITNAFSGSNSSNPTSVSATAAVLAGSTQTLTIGPGFSATSTVPLGVVYTQKVEINDPTTSMGSFRLNGSGVAGIASSFSASKTFTGNSLDDNANYQLTLTKTAGSTIALLSDLRVVISIGAQTIFDSATASTSLSTQFASGSTASYTFNTGDVNNVTALTFAVSGSSTVALLGNSFVLNGASLLAVPESSSVFMLASGAAFLLFRKRRRAHSF